MDNGMENEISGIEEAAQAVSRERERSGRIWRSYGYYIFFPAVFFMYETVLRLSTIRQFGFPGFLFSVFFTLIPVVFISYAMTYAKKRVRVVVNNVVLTVAAVFYISQIIYYNVFGTYYNTESMGNAGQILEFWETILATALSRFFPILLCIAPIPVYNVIVRKTTIASVEKKLKRLSRMDAFLLRKRRSRTMLVLTSVYIIMLLAFIPFARDPTTSYSMFFGQQSYEDSIKNTGLLSTLQIDLLKIFVEEDASGSLMVLEDPRQLQTGSESTGVPSQGATPAAEDPGGSANAAHVPDTTREVTTEPIVYGFNVMDIDFDALMDKEKDNAVKSLHEYFAYVQPTRKHEYTGMFEGYNLIMFVAEGFSPYAVHPELTPTLYKLIHEGFYFTDFYTSAWGVSTTDGEYVACTGLLPKSGVWSFSRSRNNYLPFVMGNQLRNLGYQTNAYHNHTHTYYNRHESHPNLGYVYKGIGNGLVLPRIRWPNSDLEMMEATMDEYIRNEPFHAYYMTVSGHLEYNFVGNQMAMRNKAAVADLPYSDPCKAYIACNIELDKALAYMLERLNEAGIAERTVIVLSSDHHPYGLPGEEGADGVSEFLGRPVEKTFELYKNHLIIYAQGMKPVVVDKPSSSIDIIPTISNLLGLTYDSRLLMGRDILSDSEGLVVFKDRSFITCSGSFKRGGEFIPNPGVEVDENYKRFISSRIDSMFTASARILDLDYYRKVFW